ncbi:transcriptional regulator, GntR family [Aliiroseovarius halocynthiae]|uniref:GntR family transcriptional regulator n=1 Tax=Aliiroseovarius halocynthiae TaxID=985055 RepID=A0A545SL59_9RHOB|nr:GntR family transcriptional regulator [Aliiroseovarius halocynthiae]TQV65719.1 GntR family transcriptional regulator [Aliiroseovarius halocynthiae]SMR83969.1 transcriptional regulator, GntR family [Aliiroseovarius halocynthiae]
MARSSRQFRKSYNETLTRLQLGIPVPNPTQLALQLGISRTTSRKIQAKLQECGLISSDPTQHKDQHLPALRSPRPDDFFPKESTLTTEARIQEKLMTWVIDQKIQADGGFTEAQVVRALGISHAAIREFLIRLSSFGLIRREPSRRWKFQSMTRDYADEVYEFRKFIEFRSLRKVLALPDTDPIWSDLRTLKLKHLRALERPMRDPIQFKELDVEFHAALNQAARHRFLLGNDDAVSLLFFSHYHLSADQHVVSDRNERTIHEHIRIIDALISSDLDQAVVAMEHHLDAAKRELINRL